MAPNKFATMLHRKTNRITLVLVYAVLEWALIFFLLLNSLFSYLIIKFAHYFGLKPPCLLCSRLDHILEPQNPNSSYRDLMCEQHAIELSRSGYCYNHRKLVESQDTCKDCRWPVEVGVVKSDDDCIVAGNDDVNLRCSCCGVTINSYVLSPHPVIKPSSEVLDDTHKANRDELQHPSDFDVEPDQNRIAKLGVKDQDGKGIDNCRDILMGPDSDDNSEGFSFWLPEGGYSMVEADAEEGGEVLKADKKPLFKISTKCSYANETVLPQHVEFYIDLDDYQLVPVDLVNLETRKSEDKSQVDGEEDQKHWNQEKSTQLCRETDEELELEPVTPHALNITGKLSCSSLHLSKIDDSKIEDLPTEQGQELEMKREINVGVELDETDMKDLSSKQSHEEEIKREVGDGVVLHANKVEMLPTIESEAEVTRREIDFQVAGDQSHGSPFISIGDQPHDSPFITIGDQVTEETELNELNVNIPTAENDETKVEDLPTKQGQELGMKREIVVEVEFGEVRMKEVSNKTGGEEELEIEVGEAVVLDANKVEILPIIQCQAEATRRELDFQDGGDQSRDDQFSAIDDQVTEETELNSLNDSIPTSDYGDVCHTETDETNIEELRNKQAQELEITKLCDTETKELSNEKDQEEEKREVDDAVFIDTNQVEILPTTIQGQTEMVRVEISFQVSGDQLHDAPLSANDDQVSEKIELNANIASSGDLSYTENDEIDIAKSSESTDKSQMVEPSVSCKEECPSTNITICQASTSSSGLLENGYCEPKQIEETQNHNYIRVEIAEQEFLGDSALAHEPNEETPFLQNIGSADQETLEESVANELDNVDGAVTFEELKSVLKSERNALRALYTELEEERNASAVATNQTMLMISRLQKEKATIEMEALQYQRMMEEQSEYDQEALQLMNEILVKREKELQEVEKELEIHRKKVTEYEEREKMRLMCQGTNKSCKKGRNSSASCSNGEESEEVYVDLNSESREEENGYHEDTPVDAILNLEDSFDEERMSILEHLKVLEEKLCTLAEEEEDENHNFNPFERFNGNGKLNGDSNGKHHGKSKMNGQKPKQLLPLFDAAELESDDEALIGVKDVLDPVVMIPNSQITKFESENKRLAIEEEMDHMYDRLHGLEADREFIKHCIGSLSKGDRGVHLLQEILQHLRDLKNVELQARSIYGVC